MAKDTPVVLIHQEITRALGAISQESYKNHLNDQILFLIIFNTVL